ncbi:MAG TPA: prephenate dehydratase [Bacteroidales bacterium]|jgi:prephenate dehydratase|nr:prephenate dehydratase [Bacteroidales bacterium]HOX73907.1 prephenate dehydratase [Bacteroidales bacterium]HPM88074.1 prephenate dehydratase [Bacteroidales bacterium]HQM68606.1 prephenate dehydratase [Bacteroidales bacterium]
MKISIQGEQGSFHEVAARQYFKDDSIDIVPCSTFDLTLMAVKDNRADFAMMAIENARSGSILSNYTLIRESGMKILGEHNLRIKQNLMALPGQPVEAIREIRSHPIAINQCMTYLNRLRGITLIETEDTAGSARYISENRLKGVAAISSAISAEMYGLEIIAPGIETYKKNYTRFLMIGEEKHASNDGNKTSVSFCTGHKPGSLATVLVRLAEMDVNLSKIQSVPRLNGDWEYMFYADLELNPDHDFELVRDILENYALELEVLGIYAKDDKLYES